MSLKLEIKLEKLFIAAINGDNGSYAEFLRLFASYLQKSLSKKIFNTAEIDDVSQEILLSVHKARHTYDGNRPLKPWLISIITFRVNDYLRKFYRDKTYETFPIDDNFDIEDENLVTESPIDNEEINRAISNLSQKQQEVIKLMYFKELSVKEVAVQLGYSESDVKVTAHRAYKILREKIKK